MNRPIFILLIGYIIGIIWGLYLKTNIILLYLIFSIIYFIINFFKSSNIKDIFKINYIILILISSFISYKIIQKSNFKYDNLYIDKEEMKLDVIIISNKKEKEYYNRYKVKVITKKYYDTYLYITTKNEVKFGDILQIEGKYDEPQTARNYKGFNYKEYLKTLKIYGTLRVSKIDKIGVQKDIFYYFNKIYLKIKDNLENTYNEHTQAIILGILLGNTEQIDEETRNDFSQSSISHVLAISGLHVSYIIYLIEISSQNLVGIKKSRIIQIIILIIYMSITGYSLSVIRACIMSAVSNLAFFFRRKSDTITNISLSALIILIWNPFCIYSTSFLFTYLGTIGVVFLRPIIEDIIINIKSLYKLFGEKYKIFCQKNIKLIEAVSVAISAQIMTLPVILVKYNMISVSFIITNLLVNVVIGIIVIGGFIQVIITFFSQKIGIAIAKIIQIPIMGLIGISKISSLFPFFIFKVKTPKLYQILIYYLLVLIFNYIYNVSVCTEKSIIQIFILRKYNKLKKQLIIFQRQIIAGFIVIIIVVEIIKIAPKELKIYFVDVGQGDCCLIITPKNKNILIDGGGQRNFDVGTNTLVPYLLNRGILKIDYCIISHFDQDHCRTV